MISPKALLIVSPETTIRAALEGLARAGVDALPVMEGGLFAGLLTRRAVAAAIRGRADRTRDLPVVSDTATAGRPPERGGGP